MKKIITLLLVLAPAYIAANGAGVFEEPPASASSSLSTSSSEMPSLSSSAADDEDDVADAIMGGMDRAAVVQEYFGSLPDAQQRLVQRHLKGLTDSEFSSYMVKLGASRWWGSKKPEDKDKVAAAMMALVRALKEQNKELKRQTEQMQGSGELQKAAYEQQVASAEFARYQWKMGFLGAVGTAVVTNAIQAVFNIMQANTLAEQSDNTTAC